MLDRSVFRGDQFIEVGQSGRAVGFALSIFANSPEPGSGPSALPQFVILKVNHHQYVALMHIVVKRQSHIRLATSGVIVPT